MKSVYSVYQKLREVRFRHLTRLYKKYLKRCPENCKYNIEYILEDSEKRAHAIRLCTLHQDAESGKVQVNLLAVCQRQSDCENCNAFIHKYTKDDVKKILIDELSDRKIREGKYPDICALEWVLERKTSIKPTGWFMRMIFTIKEFLKKELF